MKALPSPVLSYGVTEKFPHFVRRGLYIKWDCTLPSRRIVVQSNNREDKKKLLHPHRRKLWGELRAEIELGRRGFDQDLLFALFLQIKHSLSKAGGAVKSAMQIKHC